MKITILGANSFLARNFYKFLISSLMYKEDEILLYDIQDAYLDEVLSIYEQIDFLDNASIKKIDFSVDAVFMFIGKTGTVAGFDNYKDFIQINEIILLNILNHMKEIKSDAKFIYPSTRLIYEGDLGHPSNEDDSKELKSIYAITKYAAEQYIELYHRVFGIKYCMFRICTPWGSLLNDTGNYGTFAFFIESAKQGKPITVYGDGSVTKTYTSVEDICQILEMSIENNQLMNGTFNIGGVEKSLQEIAEMIAEKYHGSVVNVEWPDLSLLVDGGSLIMDSKRLDDILNFKYQEIHFD